MYLHVPVKSHVYQYLSLYFPKHKISRRSNRPPILIEVNRQKRNLVIEKVFDLINRPPEYYNDYIQKTDFPYQVTLEINHNAARFRGFVMDADKISRFNRFVEQLLLEVFFTTVDNQMQIAEILAPGTITLRSVIEGFIEYYQLDSTDYNYEQLKKSYYRYRTAKGSNVPSLPNSSQYRKSFVPQSLGSVA